MPIGEAQFSLLTPPGRGGIAVFALHGPDAAAILSRIFKPLSSHREDADGVLRLGRLVDERGEVLDEAVVARCCDVVEINIHGGPLVARKVADTLERLGAKPAPTDVPSPDSCGAGVSPACLAGILPARLCESLGDLHCANRAEQLARAGSPRDARAGRPRHEDASASPDAAPFLSPDPALPAGHRMWRNPAVGAELLQWLPRARSELAVRTLSSQWSAGVSRLARETLDAISWGPDAPTDARAGRPRHVARSLRDAAGRLEQIDVLLRPREVVFLGPPNAGKSSLVNALVGRPVSIVHDQPGTTRDWVRELALLHGVPAYLTDTAGLWEQAQGVDAQAVARSRERAQSADVVVLCGAGQPPDPPPWLTAGRVVRAALQMDRFDVSRASRPRVCGGVSPPRTSPAPGGEGDCASSSGQAHGTHNAGETPAPRETPAPCRLSAVTGHGLDEFKHAIVAALGLAGFEPAVPAAFTERQRDLLLAAAADLEQHNTAQAVARLRQLLE